MDGQQTKPRSVWYEKYLTASGEVVTLCAEIARLTAWVNDLQCGLFINCVYCGHRYGPRVTTPATIPEAPTMAEALTAHIAQCPKHPLASARAEICALQDALHELTLERLSYPSRFLRMTDDEAGRWWHTATAKAGNWPSREPDTWDGMPQPMKDVFIHFGQAALAALRKRAKGE